MKDFDLAAAKRGATVCTRDGRPARILCFDFEGSYKPIVAAIKVKEHEELIREYSNNGRFDGYSNCYADLMMADDDYLEKLDRGEYDHIGETTEKVEDPISLGNEWLNDMIKAKYSIFKDLERSLDIESREYELSKLKHEADMLELERIPENWDYWRRMYAGMALQGLVASDKWRMMEMGDRVFVCVQMADALVDELKNTKK